MNTNNSGITNVDVLSVGALYIGGKRFRDIIRSLIAEDALEQLEIDTLRTLLTHLKTDGLSSEWIVNNDNRNAVLKTAITAIETKLAKIDTTALTEPSVLNNDNRNSVLKTRLDTAATDITSLTTRVTTAEGDIDNLETRETNVENKTKYITTSTTAEIPGLSGVTPAYIKIRPFETDEPIRAIDLFVNPDEPTDRGYLVAPVGRQTYMRMIGTANMTSLSQPQYNKIEMQTNRFSLEANDIKITCNPLDLTLSVGEISVPGTITLGAKSDTINIGTEPPNPLFENHINIGVVGFPTKSITSIKGFLNVAGCEWVLPKSDKFGLDTLIAFIPTAGLPAWVLSFALGSSIPSFEYSDIFVMKDGETGVNKSGEVTTSNEPKVKSLVLFNRDLNIARLTPIEGTFVASGTISKTTLNGSIRNSVFLDGGGDNKICLKHHNIAATDITEWATTEGNDKVNVFEIGGDSGILLHQGAANAGTDIKIINSKAGNIVLKVGTGGGIKSDTKESFTVLHDANYPGAAIGRLSPQAYATDETARTNNPIARLEIDCVANRKGIRLFGYDPASPFTLGPDETNLTNQLINTPAITTTTATATSYVINGNYTGDTTNRLYKDADNKLYWNGAEVGAGGSSSGGGGIDYYIPLANNIVNPAPNPTIQFMDELYVSNVTKTIKQSTTAVATGLLMASYRTPVFNKESNPTILGVQTVQQWLDWSENNTIGQIYGRLYYESAVSDNNLLYDRKYTNTVSTSYATVINGTPINAPASLFLISFQRVIFEFVDIDVTGTSCQIKCRLEGQDLITENWNILQTSLGTKTYTSDSINQNIDFLGENFSYEQTSTTNAPIKYRVSLYVSNGGGSIRQTVAGGTDLGAYQLGSNSINFARIRVLLYDGINQKKTIQHSTTPILFSLDLPVSVPYNISPFNFSRLGVELYMYQPTGGVNSNHIMTFYFNDGYISHFETSLNIPPVATPTLAQVMTSGAIASSDLSMGNFGITNVSSIENWNVKQLSNGTNITTSNNGGNYTITNNAPVQDINNNGTNITVSKTSNVATITNSAPVQDINNNGTNITVSKTSNVATITNSAPVQDINNNGTNISVSIASNVATINNTAPVQNIAAGAGIDVQINATTKTATITNLGVTGQATRDEDQALIEVGALPRKPDYWATNWAIADNTAVSHQDIYVSVDGKYIVSASGYFNNRYSIDYGTTWNNGNVNVLWTSVCGTSQGSKIFGFATFIAQNQAESLVFYTSANQGANWTQRASATFSGLTKVHRVRCSGDGTYVIATVINSAVGGRFLFSINGMLETPIWTSKQLLTTLPSGRTVGACMARSGATQFIIWIKDDNLDSKIFRSFDYGNTWTEVFGHLAGGRWTNIECDATGRFVWATRFDTVNNPEVAVWRSDNYGSGWVQAVGWNSIEEIWVSGTGQFVLGVSVPNPYLSNNRYLCISVDYGISILQYHALGNTTLFRTLNGSADGSVLVLGSASGEEGGFQSDGKIRIARQGLQNIQDLSVVGGTIAKLGGVYTLTNDVVLWVSSVLTRTNTSVIPLTFQAIDLTQFNIQYEFDINWNHAPSGTTIPDCFIEMNLNGISTAAIFLPQNQTGAFPAQTNWTNAITEGNTTTVSDINQSYRQRFFTGYAPLQVQTTTFRNRTRISGELSLSRRITGESGITDNSINSRQLLNKFNCDNSLIQNISTTQWYSYAPANSGSSEWAYSHQRIHGTAIWELSAGDFWSAGPTPFNAGISNLTLFFSTLAYGVVNRSAETSCRIYRVRK
jgi:hypothetical protein